eukprot:m.169188 g.169188  ORF g.169188 m.169188 type:complete len:402 (-) comp13070_c0_seq1:272-1477(-)
MGSKATPGPPTSPTASPSPPNAPTHPSAMTTVAAHSSLERFGAVELGRGPSPLYRRESKAPGTSTGGHGQEGTSSSDEGHTTVSSGDTDGADEWLASAPTTGSIVLKEESVGTEGGALGGCDTKTPVGDDNYDAFEELLSSEMTVDVAALRAAAEHGVPHKVRGEVWLYLLGVRPESRHVAVEHTKQLNERYARMETTCVDSARISFEMRKLRDVDEVFHNEAVLRKIRNVVCAYVNDRGVRFVSKLVRIAAPLGATIESEAEMFAALCAIMDLLDDLEPLSERSSKCMAMIRSAIPELVQHCEDEDLDLRGSITEWLEGLLVLELPLEAVLVLWDTYIARGFWFHSYICIGLLDDIQDRLEDVDEQEFRQTMQYTPIRDIHEVVVAAENHYESSRNAQHL